MIRTIVSNFEDQNIKKASNLVIQHTVTNPEEIKQLKGLMHTAEFYYDSNKATSSLTENDVQLDTTYSYLAPASTFSILFENTPGLSNTFYIHKSTNDPIALVFWFLFPLLCILTHNQYPFYSSSPFNNILPKLAIILEKANENKWCSVLTYIYIKELLVAYFSYKVSPNDYYCWPNEEDKNSAINDFFELFLLKNINKMTTNSAIDIEQNNNYYLGSKFVNLVYIPKNIFLPEKYKENTDPLRTICMPIIFDHKH